MSCPDCFKGFVHTYAEPQGTTQQLHGIRTYVAGKPEQRTRASTVVFLTDAFGFNLVNSKLLADHFVAASGFNVLIPDVVPNSGMPLSTLGLMNQMYAPLRWWDLWGYLRKAASFARLLWYAVPLVRGTAAKYPVIVKYARDVKASLPAGAKLGLAGYCWGAMQSVRVSQEPAVEGGKEKLVDANYTAHPASMKPEEFVNSVGKFNVPFSLAIGDKDFALPKEGVLEIEAALRKTYGDGEGEYKWEVTIYPDASHGFAVRADRDKTSEDEAANKAADQAIQLFNKHLS